MRKIKRTITVKVKDERGNVQYREKEVELFDRKYGKAHKEQKLANANKRIAEWQKLTPQQQLEYLDKNHLSAPKQRARIAKAIEIAKSNKNKNHGK